MTDIDEIIKALQTHQSLDLSNANIAAQEKAQMQQTILDLQKKIHDLTKPSTLFGACPSKPGGVSLAAAQKVPTKWGGRPSLRQFLGGWSNIAYRPSSVSIAHWSWNTLTGMTQDTVKAALVNVLDGDVVEVIHEGDNKVRSKKSITLPNLIKGKNQFYDYVKAVRPNVLVANTLTGGILSNYTADAVAEPYGAIKADVLGVDCDGVHDKEPPLAIPYEDEIAEALAFAKKFGYPYVAAPEFGTSRPSWDDGTQRAAWFKKYDQQFADAGFLYVCVYDYDSTPGNELVPGSPEFAAHQPFIAGNKE